MSLPATVPQPIPAAPTPSRLSPTDSLIGDNIRLRRITLGLTQHELGQSVGRTFQQIQKYEKGSNRVSAAMLISIAQALRTSPASLLPGDADTPGASHAGDRETIELVRLYHRIAAPEQRNQIRRIARTLAGADAPAA